MFSSLICPNTRNSPSKEIVKVIHENLEYSCEKLIYSQRKDTTAMSKLSFVVVMFDLEQVFANKYKMWNMLTSLWFVNFHVMIMRIFSRAAFSFSFFSFFFFFLFFFCLCICILEPERFLINENTLQKVFQVVL